MLSRFYDPVKYCQEYHRDIRTARKGGCVKFSSPSWILRGQLLREAIGGGRVVDVLENIAAHGLIPILWELGTNDPLKYLQQVMANPQRYCQIGFIRFGQLKPSRQQKLNHNWKYLEFCLTQYFAGQASLEELIHAAKLHEALQRAKKED